MIKSSLFILVSIFCFVFLKVSYASPWFTGPIIARSGTTIPLGHYEIRAFDLLTKINSSYNSIGKTTPQPELKSTSYLLSVRYGLSDHTDFALILPYIINKIEPFRTEHIGDTALVIGYQVMKQKPGSRLPSLRFSLEEDIPTGRFKNIDPKTFEIGVSGGGSYQTVLSLTLEHLAHIKRSHYLKTRCDLRYLYGLPFRFDDNRINNASVFGIKINPHSGVIADLAAELTLTQNWVAVMETFWFSHQAATFPNNTPLNERGILYRVGHPRFKMTSLLPAIEYNFSKNVGIIAGVWFTVNGRNTPVNRTAALSLKVAL
jgi:hypothetical protein